MEDFEHLSASLSEFVAQPDTPCLLLMISDSDTLYPSKALAAMDRQDPHTVYLVFSQPCHDAVAYMDAVVDLVRVQLDAVLRQAEGEETPEGLPEAVLDPREPPSERLLGLIEYLRDFAGNDVPFVWGLLPETIGDTDGYRALVQPLMPTEGVPEWARGHHFIVREVLDGSIWAQSLHEAEVDDALVFRFEASHTHVSDALVVAAGNPNNTDDERMAALVQLAGLDVVHRRLPEALAKYDALQQYYGATDNPGMRALVLGGTGDALRFADKPVEALAAYRQGLAISVPAEAFPETLNLLMAAGTVCSDLEDWAEAEGYFGLAIDVAAKLLNVVALCDSYENRGIAHSAQGHHKDAVSDWMTAKNVAKRYGYALRFESAIERLIETYRAADLPDKVRALEIEKAAGVEVAAA